MWDIVNRSNLSGIHILESQPYTGKNIVYRLIGLFTKKSIEWYKKKKRIKTWKRLIEQGASKQCSWLGLNHSMYKIYILFFSISLRAVHECLSKSISTQGLFMLLLAFILFFQEKINFKSQFSDNKFILGQMTKFYDLPCKVVCGSTGKVKV